jgi:hypothetical protein
MENVKTVYDVKIFFNEQFTAVISVCCIFDMILNTNMDMDMEMGIYVRKISTFANSTFANSTYSDLQRSLIRHAVIDVR